MSIPKYIAVEGPIGVGKTSVVRLIAEHTGARTVLEDVEENPFLREFYKDTRGKAFQTQIFFLLSRYRQQQVEFRQFDLFAKGVISDYLFAKDRIFAYQTLDEHEVPLYEQVYSLLEQDVPKPDLVIYLQASTEALMERIRKRDREYERKVSQEYIGGINEAYNRFFFNYTDTPLLVIQTSGIDFVKSADALHDLMRQIDKAGPGTLYYRPMPV
ncbi:MAG TPA: deoxynucleoside kinase [Nitrospirota bacterium]